jgi:hypothetical protein
MLAFCCAPVAVDLSIASLGECKAEDPEDGELWADVTVSTVVAAGGDDCSWADMPKPIAIKSPTPCVVAETVVAALSDSDPLGVWRSEVEDNRDLEVVVFANEALRAETSCAANDAAAALPHNSRASRQENAFFENMIMAW